MEKNQLVVFVGTLTTTSSGVKTRAVYGGNVTMGYRVTVRDEDDRYLTSFSVKTLDAKVAEQLASAVGKKVELNGYIRTENIAPKEATPNWLTFFYATDAVATVA